MSGHSSNNRAIAIGLFGVLSLCAWAVTLAPIIQWSFAKSMHVAASYFLLAMALIAFVLFARVVDPTSSRGVVGDD